MIASSQPMLVHSDVARGLLAAKRAGMTLSAGGMMCSLMSFLGKQVDSAEYGLLFPAFNYEYGKTRVFDVDNDPVQVGALPEWVRQRSEFFRTEVPFFSVLSKTELPLQSVEIINPFGKQSVFQWLVDHDGTLMLFGAGVQSLTFIHYVEEIVGKPVYRYEKKFPGTIVKGGSSRPCNLCMHVRPIGVHLDYDWPRLEIELCNARVLHVAKYSRDIKWMKARQLLEFWGSNVARDPFYLLDDRSRSYFAECTDGGRVRVTMEDYEVV
jgi:aminoglycoside N3'-acetyltransferase